MFKKLKKLRDNLTYKQIQKILIIVGIAIAVFYGVGYLDDVAVILYTIKALHDDLQDYKEYKATPEYAQRRKERDKQIAQKKKEKEEAKRAKELEAKKA